jgi:hypothetical protein
MTVLPIVGLWDKWISPKSLGRKTPQLRDCLISPDSPPFSEFIQLWKFHLDCWNSVNQLICLANFLAYFGT